MDFRFIQYYGDTFHGYDNAQNILYVRQNVGNCSRISFHDSF